MRRKVSQAFLNASHRKKFENHWFTTLITAMFLKQFKVTELKSEHQFFQHTRETWFSKYASLRYRFSAFPPQTIFFCFWLTCVLKLRGSRHLQSFQGLPKTTGVISFTHRSKGFFHVSFNRQSQFLNMNDFWFWVNFCLASEFWTLGRWHPSRRA